MTMKVLSCICSLACCSELHSRFSVVLFFQLFVLPSNSHLHGSTGITCETLLKVRRFWTATPCQGLLRQHQNQHNQEFINCLNTLHPNVNFTFQIKQDSIIPFVNIYQKPPDTCQYLNFISNHNYKAKQSIVTTLLEGAQTDIFNNE